MTDEYGIPEIECHSAEQFLSELDETHSRWWRGTWIYGGQNDASWRLHPRAMRADSIIEKLTRTETFDNKDNVVGGNAQELDESLLTNILRHAFLHVHVTNENLVVSAFTELADKVGLSIPYDRFDNEGMFEDLSDRLEEIQIKRQHPQQGFTRIRPNTIAYALAQHHGIPTRLLDWTYRPLFAAFFAAYTKRNLKPEPERIVVWAVNNVYLHSTDCRPVAHRRGDIGFLQAQDGLFLYDIDADNKFRTYGLWLPFEKELAKLVEKNGVYKLTLPYSERNDLLWRLQLKQVSKAFLMPSFDNVAKAMVEDPEDWKVTWARGK